MRARSRKLRHSPCSADGVKPYRPSFPTILVLGLPFLFLLLVNNPPANAADSLVRYEASHQAMGTVFTVVAYGSSSTYLEEVSSQVFQEIDSLDDEMSNYKPDSELSSINRQAACHPVMVEPHLLGLIQDALHYSKETGGDFDITVGPLMKAWGFFRGHGRLPSHLQLTQVLKQVGYEHVELNVVKRTIRFDKPGIKIDLGAIAKGYAVDETVKILRDDGIEQALISSGTSCIYALGSPPGESGWKISVRNPLHPSKSACVLRLRNIALSVSGDYERFFRLGGKTYSHIMDPHTGMPAENMLSTAVISLTATDSDALSTSFFVGGLGPTRAYLKQHPNLIAILFSPTSSARGFRQIVLKSNSASLPADALVRIDCH